MNIEERTEIIKQSWSSHKLIESAYLNDPSVKGDDNWLAKQRLLLADMALHLLQTALKPREFQLDKLTNNIYSILTISDQFLPDAELTKVTEKLFK